jgi:hypothetical protein
MGGGFGCSCPECCLLATEAEGIMQHRLEEAGRGRSAGGGKRGRRVLFLTYRSNHVSQRPLDSM